MNCANELVQGGVPVFGKQPCECRGPQADGSNTNAGDPLMVQEPPGNAPGSSRASKEIEGIPTHKSVGASQSAEGSVFTTMTCVRVSMQGAVPTVYATLKLPGPKTAGLKNDPGDPLMVQAPPGVAPGESRLLRWNPCDKGHKPVGGVQETNVITVTVT